MASPSLPPNLPIDGGKLQEWLDAQAHRTQESDAAELLRWQREITGAATQYDITGCGAQESIRRTHALCNATGIDPAHPPFASPRFEALVNRKGRDEFAKLARAHYDPNDIGFEATHDTLLGLEDLMCEAKNPASALRKAGLATYGTMNRALQDLYKLHFPFQVQDVHRTGVFDLFLHLIASSANKTETLEDITDHLHRLGVPQSHMSRLVGQSGELTQYAVLSALPSTEKQQALLEEVRQAYAVEPIQQFLRLDRSEDPAHRDLVSRCRAQFHNWPRALSLAGISAAKLESRSDFEQDQKLAILCYLAGDDAQAEHIKWRWRVHGNQWKFILQQVVNIRRYELRDDARFYRPSEQAILQHLRHPWQKQSEGHHGCGSAAELAVREFLATIRLPQTLYGVNIPPLFRLQPYYGEYAGHCPHAWRGDIGINGDLIEVADWRGVRIKEADTGKIMDYDARLEQKLNWAQDQGIIVHVLEPEVHWIRKDDKVALTPNAENLIYNLLLRRNQARQWQRVLAKNYAKESVRIGTASKAQHDFYRLKDLPTPARKRLSEDMENPQYHHPNVYKVPPVADKGG